MTRADQTVVNLRIVIERPVVGVQHSLQAKDGQALDPKYSHEGEPLAFDFQLRIGPGPKFFGDQVRSEGPQRRFVYIRIGQLAGDPSSPWSRRMKIDIHDIGKDLLGRAVVSSKRGLPALGRTARPAARRCARPGAASSSIDAGSRFQRSTHRQELECQCIQRIVAYGQRCPRDCTGSSPINESEGDV